MAHDAGVRPIVKGRHPLMGRHPTLPQLAYFNGLGSKGSMQAPPMAAELAAHLADGTPLDSQVDLNLRTDCRT
jgi:glycine oxidase